MPSTKPTDAPSATAATLCRVCMHERAALALDRALSSERAQQHQRRR